MEVFHEVGTGEERVLNGKGTGKGGRGGKGSCTGGDSGNSTQYCDGVNQVRERERGGARER